MTGDITEYVERYRSYKGRSEWRGDIWMDNFIQCGSTLVVNRPKFEGKTQRQAIYFLVEF